MILGFFNPVDPFCLLKQELPFYFNQLGVGLLKLVNSKIKGCYEPFENVSRIPSTLLFPV